MEITPISPMWPTNYFQKVEYDTRVVKATVRINGDTQVETVYTYDKYGRLQSTVLNEKTIADV
jgi:YD repeat-containing protein